MAMSLPSQVPHDAEATNLEREAVSLPNNQENAPVAHFKAVQEDARNREKEIRERILGSLAELAQSRDGYVLRTAIAEGESVGLKEELAPLRSALAEVDELRKAALLKARKAQEKLAGDFKTAKEAQDFGGPILAAQWRAAVKEVAKPFVMPEGPES
ncbi:hypothetical protein AK812_SmicGene43228 [Symbiodinium microadriaticum]|uniref:Uncharacterized protein n=1 Tax=Symbiodinium microadriaticum TaxID=2951 RepID=A0A1Q9C1K8_SYMMI|nr:hypothetical protein AK812_SmicGene43228 [Symbiodinium microadriaticum]